MDRYNRVKPKKPEDVTKRYLFEKVLGPLRFNKKFGENWIQIRTRLTGLQPPKMEQELIDTLDANFKQCIMPAFFDMPMELKMNDGKVRSHILNLNYMFVQLFYKLKRTEFIPYFNQISTVSKLQHLDKMWRWICQYNDSAQDRWRYVSIFQIPVNTYKLT